MGIKEIAERLEEIEVLHNEADYYREMVLADRCANTVSAPKLVRITVSINLVPAAPAKPSDLSTGEEAGSSR